MMSLAACCYTHAHSYYTCGLWLAQAYTSSGMSRGYLHILQCAVVRHHTSTASKVNTSSECRGTVPCGMTISLLHHASIVFKSDTSL